jgi:hypothetical protein
VVGTRKYRAFLTISNTTFIARKYSEAQDGCVVAVAESRSQSQTVPFETVRGYIAVVYEDHWWPGCVLEKYEENEGYKVRFLHPHGPSPSFVFPSQPGELILPMFLILSMVTQTSETGITYKLSSAEGNRMSELLKISR